MTQALLQGKVNFELVPLIIPVHAPSMVQFRINISLGIESFYRQLIIALPSKHFTVRYLYNSKSFKSIPALPDARIQQSSNFSPRLLSHLVAK